MIKYTLVSVLCLFLNCRASGFDQSKAQQILTSVNQARQQAGKGPLCISSKLMGTAMQQSSNQASQDLLTHANPSSMLRRFLKADFTPLRTAENIAQTASMDAAKALEAWLASEDDGARIMGDYTHMGVAAANSPTGKIYWTLHLGKASYPMEPCDYGSQPSGSATQTGNGTQIPGSATQTGNGTQIPGSATQTGSGAQIPGSATQTGSGTQPSGNAPSSPAGTPSGAGAILSFRKLCVRNVCYEIQNLTNGANFVQTSWRPPSGYSIAADAILF